MKDYPKDCVSLIFGSPPYENARYYGELNFKLKGQEWVDWMVKVFQESLRICNGLVAFVIQGRTRNYRWSATPALLMADLHRAGIHLRLSPIFNRIGIPGSGGPDWLRCDYEYIICVSKPGRLPWSDNTVMGHPPKWAPGGAMSHRLSDGSRVNQWGGAPGRKLAETRKDGSRQSAKRPSHKELTKRGMRRANGERRLHGYSLPVMANPGNIISGHVGGGAMGSQLAHKNEAPFPEYLAEFFIRSFCAPEHTVLDPFSGSGTTIATAEKFGRQWIGIDIRESQVLLSQKRILEAKQDKRLFT